MNKLVEDIDKLISEASENDAYALESLIRSLLADEELATSHYRKAAQIANNMKLDKVEKLFNDLADEEIVHIGELNKALQLLNIDSPELVKDGEKEAADLLTSN